MELIGIATLFACNSIYMVVVGIGYCKRTFQHVEHAQQ